MNSVKNIYKYIEKHRVRVRDFQKSISVDDDLKSYFEAINFKFSQFKYENDCLKWEISVLKNELEKAQNRD